MIASQRGKDSYSIDCRLHYSPNGILFWLVSQKCSALKPSDQAFIGVTCIVNPAASYCSCL